MLIDIHSHLQHCYFAEDLDKVIENARNNKVKVILTAGTDSESNRKVLQLSEKYDIVKPCLGIHPVQNNNGKNNTKTTDNNKNNILSKNIDDEIKFIESQEIAAVGEVGLDFFWNKENIPEQKKLFEKMIMLAERLDKPIIVHSRKSEQACIDMLSSSKLKKIVMHCFSGKKSLVKEVADNGWFLTVPTCVVRSKQFQENAKITPITQLFCETDAPYLTPFKDKRNEPAFVAEAYKKLTEIKDMELKEVVNNIWMNWQRIF